MKNKLLALVTLSSLNFACTKGAALIPPESSYKGHGISSLPPEVINRFAPKQLRPELSRQIQRMLDVRGQGRGIISNDGTALYFTWGITGRPQIWKLDSSVGFPSQLTGGEDPTYLAGLTSNEKHLILSRDRAGEENPGLFIQSTQGGPLLKIFQKVGVQARYQVMSDDSNYLYFSANDKSPSSQTIYRYNFETKNIEEILNQEGNWNVADVQGNSKLLIAKWSGALQSEFFELDLKTKKLVPIFGQGKNEEIWMQYGTVTGEFIVQTNMFGNFRRLYHLKNGAFNPLTEEINHDVDSFGLDRARTRLVYTTNEDGYSKINFLDLRTLKPLPALKMEADQVRPGSFSKSGRFISLSIEKSNEPPSTYVYDFEKQELKKWLSPNAPEVDLESFASANLEFYTARDETKIPMLVRRPIACDEPCPVIVHFHGGPESQSRPGFSVYAQIFVDAGFVYVEPNVRGSDGYGKEWISADDGPRRLNVITDIEDAALFIKSKWTKNGRAPKVGVMGYSYGGYSTLMAMTKFSGAYEAGVALVGMSNLVTFLENTAPYRRKLRISEYGDPEKDRDALVKLSPTTYLDGVKDPLLIIQGASDPRVPAGEALQIYEALKAKGLAADLIFFANEGHGSIERSNQVLEIGNSLEFFLKHLM